MNHLIIHILAAYGLCCLIGFVVFLTVFGRRIYGFFRAEYGGRLRAWLNKNQSAIHGYLFIVGVVCILWLSLLITHPA